MHEKSGQKMGYGDIASAAATIEVPEEIELKDPKDFKIIGTSRKNVDAKKIAMGEPLFGWDIQKEGMLIAMLVHPPSFGMKIKSYDPSNIKAMPGIVDVFEIDLTPDGVEKQWSDVNAFNQLIAIVGQSTWEVMKAKRALNVEWEVESALENTEDHYRLMDEQLARGADKRAREDGDPEAAFKNAARIIETNLQYTFLGT